MCAIRPWSVHASPRSEKSVWGLADLGLVGIKRGETALLCCEALRRAVVVRAIDSGRRLTLPCSSGTSCRRMCGQNARFVGGATRCTEAGGAALGRGG
jgi:hypothetical protein